LANFTTGESLVICNYLLDNKCRSAAPRNTATGLTDREIADRLVMSMRTVEGHLLRASQRAGVNTRADRIALS
jgi:FixJ family two-component response regulator